MNIKKDLEADVLSAAAESGIGITLFRNALAKKLGLNLTESLCLTVLGTQRATTPTDIAHFTDLTTGATTTMLDRLEKRNFIRRKPNPHDRRGVLIETEEAYASTAKDLVAGIQTVHRDLIAAYPEEELRVIWDFLVRFGDNLKVYAAKIEGTD